MNGGYNQSRIPITQVRHYMTGYKERLRGPYGNHKLRLTAYHEISLDDISKSI